VKITDSHQLILSHAASTTPALHFDGSQKLDVWQAEARAKLNELLCLPLEHCDSAFEITEQLDQGTHTEIKFTFQSEPGYFIPCHLLVPKEADKPRPVVICLQGHSTGKHISLGQKKYECDTDEKLKTRDFARQAVQNGFCAVVFDQRYMGVAGLTETGAPHCLQSYSAQSAILMGRTPIGERVWDIMRLIDLMEDKLTQYIDTKKIICLGNSGGGTATFYAACMDERISLAVPSCAVCTYEQSIMAMFHCACNYIPHIRKYFDMGDLGCLIAPRPLVVVSGMFDKIFPISGAEASFAIIKSAYEQVGKGNLCRMVKGDGGHQFYPDEAWPIIHELLNMED
jgi:dienelactone hydrolase